MKTPRITVAHLVILVAVVGVNLGVVRAVYAYDKWFLYATVLMGLAIQFAFVRILNGRGQARMFWLGFALCGFAASASCLWAMSHFEDTQRSVVLRLWDSYFELTSKVIIKLPHGRKVFSVSSHPVISGIAGPITPFPPQLVVALMGGLIARQLAKWFAPHPFRESQTAPSDCDAGS